MKKELTSKYDVVLGDPPWMRLQVSGSRGAINHYPLMDTDRIANMPINDLTAPNSHLYLWVTNASISDGFKVIEAWGFTYRSCITWVKPRLGLGNYMRNCTEHLLFATKGKAPILCNRQPNIILGPVLEHSHKPEEQYALIDRCSPKGKRLELFARRRQPGWDVWGDEVESDLEISGYPVPKVKGRM